MRKVLYVLFALMFLGSVIAAGALRLSFWTVPGFAVILTFASLMDRFEGWRLRVRTVSPGRLVLDFLLTAVVQTVLAALIFFLSYGIAVAITGEAVSRPFDQHAVIVLAVCLVTGIFAGIAKPRNHLQETLDKATRRAEALGFSVQAMSSAADSMATDSTRTEPAPPPPPFEDVMDSLQDVEESDFTEPLRLEEIALNLAVQPDRERTLDALGTKLQMSEDQDVRRIAMIALHYMAPLDDTSTATIDALLLAGLADDDPHVRDYAVRAAGVLRARRPAVIAALQNLVATSRDDGDISQPPADPTRQTNDPAEIARDGAVTLLARFES